MSERELTAQECVDLLDDLVNGPTVRCSCGGRSGDGTHHFEVRNGRLIQAAVGGSPLVRHFITARGGTVLVLAHAEGGYAAWHAYEPDQEIIL